MSALSSSHSKQPTTRVNYHEALHNVQACPLYLSEMAPSHLRGSLNICFQLATAVGILAANSLNYGEHRTHCHTTLHSLLKRTFARTSGTANCFTHHDTSRYPAGNALLHP